MFIPKQKYASPETIADGEYTAKVERIRMTKNGDSVMFICSITNEGFDNMEVTGFARADWRKPSGRTTANLLQWCKNLGANIVEGQEDLFDIETLIGTQCRIIVQSYIKKTDGSPAVKVSNILPLSKKPIPNPMATNAAPVQQQAAPVQKGVFVGHAATPQQTVQKPVATQSYANTSTAEQVAPQVAAPAFATEPSEPIGKPTAAPAPTGTTGSESEDANLW